MSQAAGADATKTEHGRSKIVSKHGDALAEERSQAAAGAHLGAKIIFHTLQYAMFDNVAEAFHFNVDLNPDLTYVKQPLIQEWTEGEKRRPVERMSGAEFQK